MRHTRPESLSSLLVAEFPELTAQGDKVIYSLQHATRIAVTVCCMKNVVAVVQAY